MTKTITAKFDSKCLNCQGEIAAGERVEWTRGEGVRHERCPSRQPEPCKHCQDRGFVPDLDDDGLDENGQPILREIELSCSCPAGRRWERERRERFALKPTPMELRSFNDRELRLLLGAISVDFCETDGSVELHELDSKIRGYLGEAAKPLPSYLK